MVVSDCLFSPVAERPGVGIRMNKLLGLSVCHYREGLSDRALGVIRKFTYEMSHKGNFQLLFPCADPARTSMYSAFFESQRRSNSVVRSFHEWSKNKQMSLS